MWLRFCVRLIVCLQKVFLLLLGNRWISLLTWDTNIDYLCKTFVTQISVLWHAQFWFKIRLNSRENFLLIFSHKNSHEKFIWLQDYKDQAKEYCLKNLMVSNGFFFYENSFENFFLIKNFFVFLQEISLKKISGLFS